MFSKLIATASVSAVAVAGLIAPASAAPAAPAPASAKLPTPSSQAKADGVQPGNAPMNWQRAGRAGGSRTTMLARTTTTSAAAAATTASTQLAGIDMASYAGSPSAATWTSYASKYQFVFIKATEGTYYSSPNFGSQYAGATTAGMMRGAYHFANPRDSGGATQADYFVAHGGGWSPDGRTLPGVLDIEYDPYTSNMCYGVSQASMIAWIRAFNNEYVAKTGVYPTIYSTVGWWKTCTGNTSAFANTNPFWIADPNTGSTTSGPSSLPAGTAAWTYWQYGQDGNLDWNKFNGGTTQLKAIATTYSVDPHVASAWTSSMGYPTGKATKVTAFGVTGYIQRFPGGKALINSKYGTYSSSGAVLTSWAPTRYGWPTGPLTAITAHGTSGYQQRFAEGSVTNARAFVSSLDPNAIWVNGAILGRYDALGGTSVMGWPLVPMTSQTAFNLKGYIQKFQSGRALISSTYGIFASNGTIYAAWKPTVQGWPTADLKTATYRGNAGWLQTFGRGSSGPDFGFVVRATGALSWYNGTP